jgi:hypothetical protein
MLSCLMNDHDSITGDADFLKCRPGEALKSKLLFKNSYLSTVNGPKDTESYQTMEDFVSASNWRQVIEFKCIFLVARQ